MLARLADGTLSRATLRYELATAPEFERVRQLDDVIAFARGARARGERPRHLQAPAGTDERLVEVPWVLARSDPAACSRSATPSRSPPTSPLSSRPTPASSSASISPRPTCPASRRSWPTRARCPFPTARSTRSCSSRRSSTSAPTTSVYGVDGEPPTRRAALPRCASSAGSCDRPGSLLVTVPLGEPGDYGWFRQEDVRGWTRLVHGRRLLRRGAGGVRAAGRRVARRRRRPSTRRASWYGTPRAGGARRCSAPSSSPRRAAAPSSRPTACDGRPGAGSRPCVPAARAARRPSGAGAGACRGSRRRDYTRAPMDFSLTADQREIQALAREFAEAEIAPHAAAWDREHSLPARALREARRARADGRLRARGARRRRRRLPLVHPRARGAVARRRGRRRHRRRAHERGHAPDRRVRHATSSGSGSSRRSRAGEHARRLRAHRARVGLRRRRRSGRAATPDGDGWTAHRLEAVDHERQPRRHVPRLRAHGSRRPTGPRGVSAFLLDARARRGRRARRRSSGCNSSSTADLRVRRRVRRSRPAPPRGGPRLHGRDGDARRRADRDRRAGGRDRAGRLRRRARVRARARASSARGSPTSRRSSASSPTWRPRSTPRACSRTAPPG